MDFQIKERKPNSWIQFLKDRAAEQGKSYAELLADKDSKVIYNLQKEQAKKSKPVKTVESKVKSKAKQDKPENVLKNKQVKPEKPVKQVKSKSAVKKSKEPAEAVVMI